MKFKVICSHTHQNENYITAPFASFLLVNHGDASRRRSSVKIIGLILGHPKYVIGLIDAELYSASIKPMTYFG